MLLPCMPMTEWLNLSASTYVKTIKRMVKYVFLPMSFIMLFLRMVQKRNIPHYVVSADGTKEKHTAHIVCNEDKDRIIEWKDITGK